MKKEYTVSIVKQEKWSNPKCIKIDVDFPCVDTSELLQTGSNRVMPMKYMGKFFSLLRKKTKTFKYADISHYWVSGYIRLEFDNVTDRIKCKKLVKECIITSGGFMTLNEWFEQHNKEKKRCKIFAFGGTGSQIKGGQINTSYEYL